MVKFYGVPDDQQPIALTWRVIPDDDAPNLSGLSAHQLKKLLSEDKIMHTPANQLPNGYIMDFLRLCSLHVSGPDKKVELDLV